jgi:D-glycero-alpha-D-manno-heptose-7-phosphate kinase
MLITRTPLRISFAGGGSDFRGYYAQHGGAVLSSAIDKYIHVILQSRFDEKIRVGYSRTELVDSIDALQHELVREALRITGITRGVEVSTMADVPSTGTGLGSSSSVTVGLLHAMHVYRGALQTRETLARQAADIEVGVLGKPIGKQDQYIAAYGGLRRITFNEDDSVDVVSVEIAPDTLQTLNDSLLLYYTGQGREASAVLEEQKDRIGANSTALSEMVALVGVMQECLERGTLDAFGRALDTCWTLKRGLASRISNPSIDAMYASARRAGALGGKITGAGGGGFLLLYCERGSQQAVREALNGLRQVPFRLEPEGSKVVFSN